MPTRHFIGEGSTDGLSIGKWEVRSPGVQGGDTSAKDWQGTVETLMHPRGFHNHGGKETYKEKPKWDRKCMQGVGWVHSSVGIGKTR